MATEGTGSGFLLLKEDPGDELVVCFRSRD